jgi:hypothetical protein
MINNFHAWFKGAKRGSKYTYHRGEPTVKQRELGFLADMAYELYYQRDILLVQKKHAVNDYEYIAVKR